MKCLNFAVKSVVALAIAGVVAFAVSAIADGLVHPTFLKKNVYVVDTGVTATPTAAPAPEKAAAAPAPMMMHAAMANGPAPITPLLAKADVEAGKKYAQVCGACHSFGKGEAAKIGPNLYGVVDGPHAHMAGFAYSAGMKAMAKDLWTFEELNHFLYNPREHVPGTKMTFAGIKDDQTRANVIAWLRTLADHPVPLPTK